jgi:hypothetical protein
VPSLWDCAYLAASGRCDLADAFLVTLKDNARDGKPFDPVTGLPAQPKAAGSPAVTWYEHAWAYSQMKWPDLAAKSGAFPLLWTPG